ncbi:hypothetical protein Esti_001286 [Eimeria stiedai]
MKPAEDNQKDPHCVQEYAGTGGELASYARQRLSLLSTILQRERAALLLIRPSSPKVFLLSRFAFLSGALRLLRPLLLDSVPGIQQTAAVAVGRLVGHSEEAAAECVNEEILPHLVASVTQQNVGTLTKYICFTFDGLLALSLQYDSGATALCVGHITHHRCRSTLRSLSVLFATARAPQLLKNIKCVLTFKQLLTWGGHRPDNPKAEAIWLMVSRSFGSSSALPPLQRFYKRSAAFVMRSIAKHSTELAQPLRVQHFPSHSVSMTAADSACSLAIEGCTLSLLVVFHGMNRP